jgi:hypothetical protein
MEPSPQTGDEDPFASAHSAQYNPSYGARGVIPPELSSTDDYNGQGPGPAQSTLGEDEVPQPENVQQRAPADWAKRRQYYIVFTVTGIERQNVKNPIIRFDAKVSLEEYS